ncbi:MAG: hypothetical protein ACR2J7_04325 [Luteimonas sp.]
MNTRDNQGAVRDGMSTGASGTLADTSSASMVERFRDTFRETSYYSTGRDWDDYAPAYRYGERAFRRYRGERFEDIERTLEQNWAAAKPPSRLVWVEARGAVLDAWQRACEDAPQDGDSSGTTSH